MSYPVTYYCPHCEAVVALEREGYLADKSVTPYPLEGWEYARPDDPFEAADGVEIVCGEADLLKDDETGCGETFYLSFVRFEKGEEVEPRAESEFVEIDTGSGPAGPRGPSGPSG